MDFINKKNAEKVLMVANPQLYLLGKGVQLAVEKIQGMANDKSLTIDELGEELRRQEMVLQISEAQSRIAQELAIAQRINTAQEVDIEEFYDTTGKGGLSAGLSDGAIKAGLTGENKRVSKKIYRFTGWHEGANGVYEDIKTESI